MDVDKKIQVSWGFILVLLLALPPAIGWIFWFPVESVSSTDLFFTAIAKIGAFGGLSLLALSLLLSGRYILLEKLFGGLDKMYSAHRYFGSLAVALLLLHPFGLTLRRADNGIAEAFSLWVNFSSIGLLLGALSFYGVIGMIVWSTTTKVKYETFIRVHRLLGVFFIFGVIHAFLLGSILEASMFLRLYLLVLSGAGIITFLLYSVMSDILHRPLRYKVIKVTRMPNDITEIVLRPKYRALRFKAGQFIYVSFPSINGQYHPFSVASGEHDSSIRLVVRQLGDFTELLRSLEIGAAAQIKGPYGGFIFASQRHKKQLWIAGGIGVTPFLSGARSLRHMTETGKIEMIYATKDKKPYGIEELEHIEHINPGFTITLFHEDTFGIVSLRLLQEHFKDLPERAIYLCGPPAMMRALEQEAIELGFAHNLYFESFTY